jgi:hypothetical protein
VGGGGEEGVGVVGIEVGAIKSILFLILDWRASVSTLPKIGSVTDWKEEELEDEIDKILRGKLETGTMHEG